MKHSLGLLAIIALSLSPAFSQEVKPSLTPEQMRASIANLEAHIAQREERLEETFEDIRDLDARVEDGIDDLVQVLENSADSPESKTRVANIKEEVISGLKKMIEFYRIRRDDLHEQLRTGTSDIPRETLENDLKIFDEHIEKRVAQIVGISASFTPEQDVEKFEVTETYAGWWGNTWNNEEISDDWRQNQRDRAKTNVNQREIQEALTKSIEDLDQRLRFVQGKLDGTSISDTERALYETDIERISATIRSREEDLARLTTDAVPDTRKLGRDEAYDLVQHLEDARGDLRSDFFLIFQRYDELNKLRAQIAKMKESLEARKKFLAEHGG
ncbi:MAG: hypothetical protein AAF733_07505 [Verrucomicrobiota bacterium]